MEKAYDGLVENAKSGGIYENEECAVSSISVLKYNGQWFRDGPVVFSAG